MNALGLVSQLEAKGIKLWVEEDHLKFKADQEALTSNELAVLRTLKAEVMAIVSGARFRAPAPPSPEVALVKQLGNLVSRLECADRWFLEHGPEHPKWEEAGVRIDHVSRELNEVCQTLWDQGFVWDGQQLVRHGLMKES